MDQGTPDKLLFKKALDLDPTHERAKIALASLDDQVAPKKDWTKRYIAAAGLGLAALLAMILYRRKPARKASRLRLRACHDVNRAHLGKPQLPPKPRLAEASVPHLGLVWSVHRRCDGAWAGRKR